MKILVSGILLLCCFSLGVSGSSSGSSDSNSDSNNPQNPTMTPIPIPNPVEHLEGLVQYFKATAEKNREQEKINQELKEEIKLLKEQNVQYFNAAEVKNREQEKIILELKGEMKSLKEKNAQDLKTLSDKFEELQNKISEDHGLWLLTPPLRGPPGKDGKDGDPGEKGDRGKVGENGEPGPKEDRGISALEASITSCSVAMEFLPSSRSKKQPIYPHGNGTSLEVLCDFETDGGGWTSIQKRSSGPANDFDRDWTAFANGFGSLDGNFWLGLENIRALTKNGDQELRIQLEDFDGNKKYAKYSRFSVSDASDFYKLTISGFAGDVADSMTNFGGYSNNGMRFTTKDKDNDPWSGNCAVEYGGSWWYPDGCGWANLNGQNRHKGESGRGIMWTLWSNYLAKSEMKIRKRK